MPNKHFPPSMIAAAGMPGIKKCFLSDVASQNPSQCSNCGGLGTFPLFLATEGPYQTPTAPYRRDGKVSKYYDGFWWVGNHEEFVCPDCDGTGLASMKQASFVSAQVPAAVNKAARAKAAA